LKKGIALIFTLCFGLKSVRDFQSRYQVFKMQYQVFGSRYQVFRSVIFLIQENMPVCQELFSKNMQFIFNILIFKNINFKTAINLFIRIRPGAWGNPQLIYMSSSVISVYCHVIQT